MRYNKLSICCFIIAFLLLINSNSIFAVTNKTYLSVTEANPKNNSVNINVDGKIVIKFNTKILKGSKFSNISLAEANNKTVSITATINNNILTIKPKSKLEYETKYIIKVPVNSIKDSKGNSFKRNYTLQFTTKKDGQKSPQNPDKTIPSSSESSEITISDAYQVIPTNVKSIHFVNFHKTSLNLTQGFENLTSIEIKDSSITSLKMSKGFKNLTSIEIKDSSITSMEMSNEFDNLKTLSIINSPITDLQLPLSLKNLTSLSIVNTPITSMPNLKYYTSLKKLNLSRSYFTELEQLSELTNLTDLNLSGNGIDEIDALKGLKNMTSLNLSNNVITNIEALSELVKLKTLSLFNNDIIDYSPVSSYFNNLIKPDFALAPGQLQQSIPNSQEEQTYVPVTKGAWTTLRNWPFNGKYDELILMDVEHDITRMMSSDDMGKVTVVGDKIYLIECDGKVKEYNPATNSWIIKNQIDELKGTKRFFKLVTINSKIYIVGANFSDILEYDPATNECIVKAKLPSKRVVGAVTVLNGKIYLFGGNDYTTGTVLSCVDEYNPSSDTWVKKKDMSHGASDLRIVSHNGKMYTFWIRPSSIVNDRGRTITELEGLERFYVDSQDFVEYDPVTDSWTIKAQANYLRSGAKLEAVNGKIIVFGEAIEKNTKYPFRKSYMTIEEYDPTNNTWAKKVNLTEASGGTTTYKNEIYFFNDGKVVKYSPQLDKNVTTGY